MTPPQIGEETILKDMQERTLCIGDYIIYSARSATFNALYYMRVMQVDRINYHYKGPYVFKWKTDRWLYRSPKWAGAPFLIINEAMIQDGLLKVILDAAWEKYTTTEKQHLPIGNVLLWE